MAQDHNDIYSIVERLRILEEGLTPSGGKGLNKQQRSVNQLSATFKPKTVAVLTSPKDPKNPMAGKLVGGNESVESEEEPLDEAITSEDVLDKVKQSFADYLKNVADEIKQDSDLKDKKREDSDLKKKEKRDRDLIAKDQVEPVDGSRPVKTVANECGLWEVHGSNDEGFEIRRGTRSLPTRFKSLEEAEMALEMFAARRRKADESADYMEEA
jgi:hypothetical protein